LSTAVPGVAAAQNAAQSAALGARQVDIAYEITFAGLSGFRIDLSAKFNGSSYDIETRTFKEGILRAVTMHYDGRNRAWGGFSPQGAQPTAGSLSIVVGDKPRTWVAQYAGGTVQEQHNPEYKPSPQNTISEEQRRGSLDPLSAGLSVGMAGDAACDRTVPINDGKRRIDVIIRKVGTESAARSGIPGAQGDVLVCEIFTRRVAGEFESAPKEAETERERPMRIWLAHMDQSPMRYPAKLEAQTGFGTIRGRILSFRERPMTPDESQAMRK
jgi:hypothetical protein